MSVDTLRDLLLGLDWVSGSYAQYKTFKSRVLLPTIEEINRIADHEIVFHEFKTGRTVTEVQLTIAAKRTPEVADEDDLELLTSVAALDVPLSEARKLLGEHDRQRSAMRFYTRSSGPNARTRNPSRILGLTFGRRSLAAGKSTTNDQLLPYRLAFQSPGKMARTSCFPVI